MSVLLTVERVNVNAEDRLGRTPLAAAKTEEIKIMLRTWGGW